MPKHRRSAVKSILAHPVAWALFALALVNALAALYSIVNFFEADTRAEALRKYGMTLPPRWDAGVMNHGQYVQWYSISQHPFALGASVLWLAAAVGALWYLGRELRQ
jgi:hypothetical protein